MKTQETTMTLDLSNKADVAAAGDKQFADAVMAQPWSALAHEHACARLSDTQFAEAVQSKPWAALEHEHACARLSDVQFASAVKICPGYALEFEHVCVRLSDAQFAEAVQSKPWIALAYAHACARLSDEQLADAVKRRPWIALAYAHACARLSDAQFASAVAALDEGNRKALFEEHPHIAKRHAQIEAAAAPAEKAARFFAELVDSVETIEQISDSHGPQAIAALMWIQNSILAGEGEFSEFDDDNPALDIVRRLPSGDEWMRYVVVNSLNDTYSPT